MTKLAGIPLKSATGGMRYGFWPQSPFPLLFSFKRTNFHNEENRSGTTDQSGTQTNRPTQMAAAQILDGKKIAEEIRATVKEEISAFAEKYFQPGLAIIQASTYLGTESEDEK